MSLLNKNAVTVLLFLFEKLTKPIKLLKRGEIILHLKKRFTTKLKYV